MQPPHILNAKSEARVPVDVSVSASPDINCFHSTSNTGFNQPLHLLRGLAIIAIVGAHAWSFMIFWTGGLDSIGLEVLFSVTEMIFHGSTLYFALISGLLFSLVLAKRSWIQFYRSKLLNVVLPYILVSLLYFSLYGGWQSEVGAQEFILSLWLGKASIHMWYIPVLLVLYLLTPLLWHTVITPKYRWIVLILVLIPLIVSRSPFPDFIKLQTFIYFLGAYTTGMLVGSNFNVVLKWITSHIKHLLIAVVLLSVAIVVSYFMDYPDTGWFSVRQSLIYLQKMMLTGIALYALHWLTEKPTNRSESTTARLSIVKAINTLGDMAFPIYFLHVFFMGWIIYAIQHFMLLERTALEIGVFGLINLIGSILASVLITLLIQKLLPNHSRKLIGG